MFNRCWTENHEKKIGICTEDTACVTTKGIYELATQSPHIPVGDHSPVHPGRNCLCIQTKLAANDLSCIGCDVANIYHDDGEMMSFSVNNSHRPG